MRHANKFTIAGEPVAKGRPRFGKGRTYTPQKTFDYEAHVRNAASITIGNNEPLEGAIALHVRAFFSMPKSFSIKSREYAESGNIRPTKRPDIDNVLKIIADALNGVAWRDDSQIVTAAVEKFYSDLPRVEVTYWSASGHNLELIK